MPLIAKIKSPVLDSKPARIFFFLSTIYIVDIKYQEYIAAAHRIPFGDS